MGCSIVSTNCPYGPSEILVNGKWGTLVPVGDHYAMAKEIIATRRDVREVDEAVLQSHLRSFYASLITEKYMDTLFP